MKITKYNLDWQIVRLKARQIKDVGMKKDFILNFFMTNKSEQMRVRILNWASMTKVAYGKDTSSYSILEKFELIMKNWEGHVSYETEIDHNFNDYTVGLLKKLHRDLAKRRWNFQYAKAPKDHAVFMTLLEGHIDGKEEI